MKPFNPIMAVLVIASVGALPLRTLAADGDKPAATAEDKNPVNALAVILAQNTGARADAGKRIEEFLLKTENGKSFVAGDVNANALGAVAREWGEKTGGVGSVAVLYFVTGPGLAAPGWALADPILKKTFNPGMKWEGRLRAALADWTGKNQIDKTKEKTQVTAFLNDAAAKAATIFADPRTKQEIDASIAGNDTTALVVPDTRTRPRTGLDAATRQYTLNDLYIDGAVVKNVSGPKDANSRTISMKIYTKHMPDGSTVNEIGIFDITDQNDIFGQRFTVGGGNQSFKLDDRTPGHKNYELKFETLPDGNRKIVFTRPDGGATLETTVSDLYLKRADQAAAMGNVVNIGGEDFYTLPQGGAKGALALFPASVIDGRGGQGRDPRNLVPSLYAEIAQRGPDGRTQNIPPGDKGGPHLGKVGGKDYHLEFNAATGLWEVKEGAGDLPKPPVTPTPPGPVTPTPPGPVTPTPEGGMSIEDLEKLLLKTPGCTKSLDDTKDLATSLKGKYGIIACTNEIDGLQQIILVPKSAQNPAQQLKYGSVSGFKLLRARFFDHYLVLQFDKQVQYLDLLKQTVEDGKETGFALSGFIVIAEAKTATKFADVDAFVDALKYYMGVTGSDTGAYEEVPKRVAAAVGNKPYNLTGGFANGKLTVALVSGGDTINIWPTVTKPGDPAPKPDPYISLSGPANAMDGAVSSVNDKYKAEFEWDKRTAKLKGTPEDAETKGVALYELVDPIGKDTDKRYLLSFKYGALDLKDPPNPNGDKVPKIFRQKFFEIFNSTNPHPGDGLVLESLVNAAVVDDRVASGYKFIPGSKKEKGALAVFQNKQVSATNAKKGAANCVGPVVWWGVAKGDAVKACEEDKF